MSTVFMAVSSVGSMVDTEDTAPSRTIYQLKVHILFAIVRKWRIRSPKSSRCCGRAPCSRKASAVPAAGVCAIPTSAIPASARCRGTLPPGRRWSGRLVLEAGDFVLLPTTPGFTMSGLRAGNAPSSSIPASQPRPSGEIRHGDRRRSSERASARRLLHLRFRRCRIVGIAAAGAGARARRSSGFRFWCGSSARKQASSVRPRSGARASRRGAADRSAAVDAAAGRAAGIAARAGRCAARGSDTTDARRSRAPVDSGRSLRRRRRCRARRSSIASRATSGCRRWNTCSPGAWPSRRICCAAKKSGSPKSPNGSATVRPAPSAPPSAAMSDSRLVATREQRQPERQVRFSGKADVFPVASNPDYT